MAKNKGDRGGGGSLTRGILLIVLLVTLIGAGTAFALATVLGARAEREATARTLTGSLSGLTAFQQLRYRQLQLIARIFATDPVLVAYLAPANAARDRDKILTLIEGHQNRLGFDLAIVLDRDGRVVARTDDRGVAGEDLAADALVAKTAEEDQAFGVWRQGDVLHHAAAMPLVRDFDLAGYVLVTLAIDDALATQLSRIGGADVVFLAGSDGAAGGDSGPTRVAGTLDVTRTAELVAALRAGDALTRASGRGETVDDVELELARGGAGAALTPLHDAAERPVGAAVVLTTPGQKAAGYDLLRWASLAAGLLALALGAVLGSVLARRATRPLEPLAAATAEIARGNYDAPIPQDLAGDYRVMAGALGALAGDLRERRLLEAVVGEIAQTLPEPARTGAPPRPQTRELALLAIELRRFAHPRTGYDAEESMARFGRDLRRIASAVDAHKGQLESVAGHRLLATFASEGGAYQALSAAAEAVLALSQRENVFDEPEPPAIALTTGATVGGAVSWGRGTGSTVLGLPVQQLESLLREATPGEIYLGKSAAEALAPVFQHAGVTLEEQRGMLSPQPLFVVPGETAARVTGVTAPAAELAEERLSLADVTAGVLLAGRFEILAELGSGRLASTFKVRDRERDLLATLKLLRPEVAADPERLERLTAQMRILRSLDHPNAVPVYDFGEVGGLPYLLMGFVRAMSLRYLLDHCPQLPTAAALRLARQIAAGLAAGHALHVAHLDLRPENVLVEPAGRALVTDFGLAAAHGAADPGYAARYRAPEQLLGQNVDSRADVYAFGATCYEMLVGRPPVTGASAAEVVAQQRQEVPEPPSAVADVPPILDPLIMRCLAPDPDQRFATLDDLLQALAAVRV